MGNAAKKTVLITGGAGFIGSHLCEKFLRLGWQVVAVDCFHTGSKKNVEHLKSNPDFSLIEHDIIKPLERNAPLDLILNFACPASPVHYQSDPVWTLKTSVLGMLNMLELAKRHKARIIQASTSEVYGDPLEHPQRETYWGHVNPIGIRSCYDEGKRAAETLCFDFQRGHGVDVGVIRIFNTYGPNMALDDGRVVSNFIVQALKGETVTMYGDGSQTRSFCYVDDLVDGIARFAELKGVTGPINLGNDKEFSVRQLADAVIELTGSRAGVAFRPLPSDDPKVRRPDLSHTKKTIVGWNPGVPLLEGLKRSIPYFRDALGGQR